MNDNDGCSLMMVLISTHTHKHTTHISYFNCSHYSILTLTIHLITYM
eukprot:UN01965